MKTEKICRTCSHYDSYANHTAYTSQTEYGFCLFKLPLWAAINEEHEVNKFNTCSFWRERDEKTD